MELIGEIGKMADDESGTRDSDEGIRSSAAPKADAEAVPEAKLLTSCRDALGLVQRFSTISDFGEASLSDFVPD